MTEPKQENHTQPPTAFRTPSRPDPVPGSVMNRRMFVASRCVVVCHCGRCLSVFG